MFNQLMQRVWSRSDPAATLSLLSKQPGLLVESVTDGHVLTLIQRMMGAGDNRFGAVFSVRQATSETAFNAYVRQRPNRQTLALWHAGTDGLSVLNAGGNMQSSNRERSSFNQGIRFTDRFSHPVEQTTRWPARQSAITYGAICEVHVGNRLELASPKSGLAASLFPNRLDEPYDSVSVRRDNNLHTNEFRVYNPAQYTVRYLVQIDA